MKKKFLQEQSLYSINLIVVTNRKIYKDLLLRKIMEYTPEQEKQIAYIARYHHLILESIHPRMVDVASPVSKVSAQLLLSNFIPCYLEITPQRVQEELGMKEKDLRGLEERCRKYIEKK